MSKVILTNTYSVKKAENPERICQGCALRVGTFFCMNRKACPDDGTGLNLYFEGSEVQIKPKKE